MAADMLIVMTYFATLLGLGILVVDITKKVNIPDALFMIFVGVLFGPAVLGLVNVAKMGDIPDFLRTLALIVIVFASSFHLKMSTFKKVSGISLNLAFGGFFFTTAIMAIAAHYLFGMSFVGSLVLASIVGGTSSAAIVTFRSSLKRMESTLDILIVESIFTDPLTVLVPLLLLNLLIVETSVASTTIIAQFWQMIAAGVGTGVLVGYGAGTFIKRSEKELSPIMGFSIALITYALASNVGGSGILSVAITALILGNMELPYKEKIVGFEDTLSTMLTISVFTLLGAQIVVNNLPLVLVREMIFIALIIFVARPIYVMVSLFRKQLSLNEKLVIAFTGPRGAAAAAIAAIPLSYVSQYNLVNFLPEAQLILLTTFLVILFTMLSSTIVGIITSRATFISEESQEPELVAETV